MGFWTGLAIGMVIAWNLFPQPKWVASLYATASEKVRGWLTALMLLVITFAAGCSASSPFAPRDIGFAKERAIAEIAIIASTMASDVVPSGPKVGDKCPDCNDPVGACGVGRTGDGRTCDRCGLCNGDGKIDEQDLSGEPVVVEEPIVEPVPDPEPDALPDAEPVEVPKEITLHVPMSKRTGWASSWFANDREDFEKRGWEVCLVLQSDNSTKVSYFDVVAPDGEVINFFSPISVDDIKHLETR
ncbi:MAG: hypothetical protein AAGJ40_09750 [Planctomycetota bacterium]